jgi:hypothetical protein
VIVHVLTKETDSEGGWIVGVTWTQAAAEAAAAADFEGDQGRGWRMDPFEQVDPGTWRAGIHLPDGRQSVTCYQVTAFEVTAA